MPARGVHGLWLRGIAAAAACVLALASTGALVASAMVTPVAPAASAAPTPPGPSIGKSGDTGGSGAQGQGKGDHGDGKSDHGDGKPTKPAPKPPAPAPAPPRPKPAAVKPASPQLSATARPAAPAIPAPTAAVVVDTTDPAPFSAQAVAALDAPRVLPVERLGPLSGISFGSGLFIWPLLLGIDVLALAVIARMALRRRLASPED